jgi:hypothetical protein
VKINNYRSSIHSNPVPFIEFTDNLRLCLLSLFEFFVFKNCVETSDITDVDIRGFDVVGTYIDGRRHIVLRRRENDSARRFNSNCEHTTFSNVNEFFPFVDEFDIILFIRLEFGIVPRRAA